jgi:hypothetical protein
MRPGFVLYSHILVPDGSSEGITLSGGGVSYRKDSAAPHSLAEIVAGEGIVKVVGDFAERDIYQKESGQEEEEEVDRFSAGEIVRRGKKGKKKPNGQKQQRKVIIGRADGSHIRAGNSSNNPDYPDGKSGRNQDAKEDEYWR